MTSSCKCRISQIFFPEAFAQTETEKWSSISSVKSEVRLERSASSDVTGPAVEPTAQRGGVTQGDWDTLDAKVLEHLERDRN